ncbi:E3 ubiquitin-protein ligase NEURL1 isoform X4 [Kryptolebias marmoratus]|uniref:E3 ubiquitin-protein ligase NEURL1 isoform X4 n=1 Tax=Kryptolebias marmoratus TaxID=37003 RepID=UPI0018AC9EF7|nr:E3 ubiquitin-protein ligase NEURL1 isoform X4 [Kryptolebias marmoratus]
MAPAMLFKLITQAEHSADKLWFIRSHYREVSVLGWRTRGVLRRRENQTLTSRLVVVDVFVFLVFSNLNRSKKQEADSSLRACCCENPCFPGWKDPTAVVMKKRETADSLGGPFPSTSHRCHHKPKRCLPIQCGSVGGPLPVSPLLFHPNAKGSQIIMDLVQKTVKRQASFCNAITFSNRPIALYEQVRLKITKKQCCWSGALRLGFTSKDPSRINPDNLPKYACPDLVSQSGFWAKALPEEFANEGNVIAFWVDKKGRVFYRINESSPMLFFSGVRTAEPLWALIDVYGLTRGVQLLDSEIVPPDCLRPRSFTTVRSSSLRREADDSRLSVSLCDLNLQQEDGGPAHSHSHRHTLHLASASTSSTCPIPQNSLNSQQSSLLPSALDSDLHFHQLRGAHIKTLDEQTVARSEHAREERTLVFTNRPLRTGETVFIKVTKSSPARSGSLSYGVTSCDPAVLRPSDLPYNPEALVDRKEFWAVCRVPTPLQSSDILGFLVNQEGEVILSHNGTNVGMQVCVDNSRPLWMFFGLHGAVTQLRILAALEPADGHRLKEESIREPESSASCSTVRTSRNHKETCSLRAKFPVRKH